MQSSACGFHIFLEATCLLDRFVDALNRLGLGKIRAPILKTQPDSKASHIFSSYREFLKVAMGDMPIESEPVWSKEYPVRTFASSQPRVTTGYVLVPFPRQDTWSGSLKGRLVPVGLRALMEHIATEMQIVTSAIGAGENPDEPVKGEELHRRSHLLWSRLFRSDFVQYVIALLFAVWQLQVAPREKISYAHFPEAIPRPGEILPLAQAAMDLGGYAPIRDSDHGYRWEFKHPGLVFGHLLAAWGEGNRYDDLVTIADEATRKVLGRTYLDFLKRHADNLHSKPQTMIPAHLSPNSATLVMHPANLDTQGLDI